jgi:DNA-binding GntR family transcriptional regulator
MLQALPSPERLIDRTYQQLLDAIADGTLAPAQRIRQAELAESLGTSRQPVSHALHLLKRQGLVEDHGKKGLRVVPIDPIKVMEFYQLRQAIDGLAASLAAQKVAAQTADKTLIAILQVQLQTGKTYSAATPIPILVRADTDFHRTLYRLSGNTAITDTTAPIWPHLMRSMASVLHLPAYAERVWQQEHPAILAAILAPDPAAAEAAARNHAAGAATRTAAQLQPQAA